MLRRIGERGQVIPLIAVTLTVLLGFGGLGVDVGYLEYRQQAQQSATDAAAIGGAQSLVRSNCADAAGAKTTALADASSNGFSNSGDVTVTASSPPQSGAFAGNACAISVQVTAAHVTTFFSRLFGYAQGMPETMSGVGMVSSNNNACIYLLNPNVTAIFNGVTIHAPTCAIAINGNANFNNGSVTAASIGYAGSVTLNGTTFPEATPAPMLPVANPCPEIPGCAYLAANAPSTSGCSSYSEQGQTTSIDPGCYSSINLNGGSVTFNPGTYVFTGGMTFNNSTVQGAGVTWYVTSTGTPPNFNGQSVNLSPPASGNNTGVLYYQVPTNTKNPNFNGPSVKMSGLIYCPGAPGVIWNGGTGGYVVMVVGSANWNNGSTYDFGSAPVGGSLVKKAVLAQ